MSDVASDIKYGERELEAFIALAHDVHFKHLLEFWERRARALALASAAIESDVKTRWYQGSVQELVKITRQAANARADIDALRTAKLTGGR